MLLPKEHGAYVVLALACALPISVAIASVRLLLPWVAPVATVLGAIVALTLAVTPPRASRLRAVGWTLVATSAVTAGILIAGLR